MFQIYVKQHVVHSNVPRITERDIIHDVVKSIMSDNDNTYI
jgi:hypothetical protein